MILTDEEKRMRDGAEGAATAAAMNLLIRYGDALACDRLCGPASSSTASAPTMPPRITRCTAGAAGPTLGSRRPGASGQLGPRPPWCRAEGCHGP